MALFKIFKGPQNNLGTAASGTNAAHEGYAYFTTDNGKFYIDIVDAATAEIGVNRIPLSADKADKDDLGNIIKNTYAASLNLAGHTLKLIAKDGTSVLSTITLPDEDTKVTQKIKSDNHDYRVILSYEANDTDNVTNTVNKASNLRYNPSLNKLSTGNINLTGELDVTGNTYLHNQTTIDSLTAGSLLVTGNTNFTQSPTAPTPASTSNDTTVATTEFVKSRIAAGVTGVKGNAESSYRVGNVNLTPANIGALALTGGTLTGTLNISVGSAGYADSLTAGGLNLNNSNIYGLNSIYTADASDNAGEGIHFYRDSTHVDTLWMSGGNIYFVPNRAIGTGTTAANSEKVTRLPASITSGRAVYTDGTTGKLAISATTSTELGYLSGVTSAIQTQLNAKAPLASPALTGTPTAPTAAAGTNTTQIATTEFVTNAVAQGFVANDAMVFKGLIGSNQTITQLPASGYNAGWTYRVADAGTFAGEYCEVGDLLIAINDGPASGNSVINADWGKVEHNIDGAVFRGAGASNSSVGSSTQPVYVNASGIVNAINYTIDKSVPSNAVFTDRYVNSATFADDSTNTAASPVKMTLTRAGSDTATVTANIPKVSSSSAGVAPKGAAVSSQSQTTKFLREDGTWAAPSYTVNTNTDTLVKQTAKTDNVNYKILTTTSASPTSGNAAEAAYDADITLNPSTNTITASFLQGTAKHSSSAHYANSSSSTAGVIKVKINKKASWMLSFTLRVYQSYNYYDYVISGYNYGTNHWFLPTAILLGSTSTSTQTVTFGYDEDNGSGSYCTLWISIPRGNYTGADIFNATNGFTQIDIPSTFTIVYEETSTGIVQTTKTCSRPWYRGETITDANTAKNLVIKLKSGTTEDTDLYTFNGSAAKALDVLQGTGIALTAAAGSLTIANAGVTGVKGNNETDYRTGQVNITPANIHGTGTTAQFWRGDNSWSNILTQTAAATLGIDTSNSKIGTAVRTLHIATSNAGSGTGVTGGQAAGLTFGVATAAYAGIYYQSSGGYGSRLYFATTGLFADGAYARMMIASDGKVGIGTTSPSTLLHVAGDVTVTGLTASQAVSTDANKKLVSTNLTVSDPTASGTGITYIATISQSAVGKITATKSTVRSASTSQTGVVQLTDSTSSTSTTTAATPNSVKSAYDLANTANTTANNHKYWANVESTSAAAYNKAPEVASVKINGDTSASAASTKNVELVYDATLEVLNFVFS